MWALIVRLGDCPPPTGTDPYAEVSAAVLGVAEERLTAADLAPWAAFAREPARRARPARRGTADPPGPAVVDPQTRARAPAGRRRTGHPPPTLAGRVLRAGRRHPRPQPRRRVHPAVPPRPAHREDHTSYTATLVVADQPPRQVFTARRAWSKKLARLAGPGRDLLAVHPDPPEAVETVGGQGRRERRGRDARTGPRPAPTRTTASRPAGTRPSRSRPTTPTTTCNPAWSAGCG